jgi:septum formation protein
MAIMSSAQPSVVLASTSAYRRDLLARILNDFQCATPVANESPLAQESAEATSIRLSQLKAKSCAVDRLEVIVIGSDQVPEVDDQLLRKPGSHERAVQQLRQCSGKYVTFQTAVTVIGPRDTPVETYVDQTIVKFRSLRTEDINRYVEREKPYDCAGGFKAEGLGIILFESIETNDPTALQGLPLIWLSSCLSRRGVHVL